jgi:hypothetical protein
MVGLGFMVLIAGGRVESCGDVNCQKFEIEILVIIKPPSPATRKTDPQSHEAVCSVGSPFLGELKVTMREGLNDQVKY